MAAAAFLTIWSLLGVTGLIALDRWLEKHFGAWAAWAFTLAIAALWFLTWWGAQ